MSYRIIFVIGAFLLLFANFSSQRSYRSYRQYSSKEVLGGSSYLPSINMSPIAKAYFTGHKKKLKRKVIKAHKSLGLMHLMTPSGLHLSSFFLILKPLIKRGGLKCLLSFLIYLLLIPFDHLNSLKRMALYSVIKTNPYFKINSTQSFLLTFALSFILGGYNSAALSFSLSFLFLGAILFCRSRKEVIISLCMIHLLINYLFEQNFSPLGFIYGLIITLASPAIFIGLIVDTIFSIEVFSHYWLSFLNILHDYSGPSFEAPIFLALPFYFFRKSPVLKRLALLCVLTLSIKEVNQIKKKGFVNKAPLGYSKKIIKKNRITHYYDSGLKCKSRLYTDHWSTHCKK